MVNTINKVKPFGRRRLTLPCRTGAATVEMAVTVGLAFFFFFGALEFCRVSMVQHTVANALYEGARQGIIPGATATEVQNKASKILSTIGVTGAEITVTPNNITSSTKEITVRIQVPLDKGLIGPAFFFVGKRFDRSLVMQTEGTH